MKRQSSSGQSALPLVPPKYEEIFRLTHHLIQKHLPTWAQFMNLMQEDAKMVTENRLPLPPASKKCVVEIFKEFRQSYKCPMLVKYDEDSGITYPQQTVDDEIGSGLLHLFDSVLASKLQHRHEHLFYQDYMIAKLRVADVQWERKERCTCGDKKRRPNILPDDFQPSKHFGIVHLFRLVYLLPDLLPKLRVEPDSMELIYSYVYRLVTFVLNHKERYMDPAKDYKLAQTAYLRRSEEFHQK